MNANFENVGSVSIDAGLFMENAAAEPRQLWLTLFDHLDDDLYDGDFSYDDAEIPRVLIEFGDTASRAVKTSHRVTTSAAKVSGTKAPVQTTSATTTTRTVTGGTTVTTTTTRTSATISKYQATTNSSPYQAVAEVDIGPEPENSNGCDAQNLEQELRESLKTTVQDLDDEQQNRFAVDDERVQGLHFLEKTHQELKGEHEQDLEYGRNLKQTADDIDRSISQYKADVGAQIADLKDQIRDVEGKTSASNNKISTKTRENKALQDTIDIPEDLNEEGFSDEARNIRRENADIKRQVDTQIDALLKESHDRDNILNQHSEEVGKYNDTIYKYYTLLMKAEQARKIHQDSLNKVQEQVSNYDGQITHNEQRVQLGEIDIEMLGQTVATLRKDHDDSTKIYNQHINSLSDLLFGQGKEMSALRDHFNSIESRIKDMNTEVEKQKVSIAAYEKEMDLIKAIGFEEKVGKLQSDLKRAEDIRQKHQDELENAHQKWETKMEVFKGEEAERKRQEDQRIADIISHIDKLNKLTGEINELYKQLDQLNTKKVTDENRDEVQRDLDKEIENISLKLRWAMEERDNSRKDLDEALALAREKENEVREQEIRIRELLSQIQELKTLLEEKRRIIEQLERDIQLAIEEIERLKKIIEDLDRRIEILNNQISEKDREIANLLQELQFKDARLAELYAILKQEPVPVSDYKAVKGDQVDEMLAKYLIDCPVPVKRLGGGFYLFGTRKIYAKIMNGKLVVRVGGGYMVISEFITTYSEPEIIKLTKIAEQYGVDSIWDLDLEEVYYSKSPGNRNSPKGSPKGESSPSFNRSKKGTTFGNSINGTNREKKFNASALVRKL